MLLGPGADIQKRNQQNRSMAKRASERNFRQRFGAGNARGKKEDAEPQPLQFGSHQQGHDKKRRQQASIIIFVVIVFALLMAIVSTQFIDFEIFQVN